MNLNRALKQTHRSIAIGLFAVMMFATSCITAEAKNSLPVYTKNDDAMRKSNKNYSNACELLFKKRTAKVKPPRKSKKRMSKWR